MFKLISVLAIFAVASQAWVIPVAKYNHILNPVYSTYHPTYYSISSPLAYKVANVEIAAKSNIDDTVILKHPFYMRMLRDTNERRTPTKDLSMMDMKNVPGQGMKPGTQNPGMMTPQLPMTSNSDTIRPY